MSNVKTLTTITIATFFAFSAFAQDEGAEPILEASPDTVEASFTSADLDQDGALNADEFVTFAVMRAENGDETFKDLVIGGEYDATFVAQDADASGGIELSELTVHEEMTAEPEMMESEDEIIAPDM